MKKPKTKRPKHLCYGILLQMSCSLSRHKHDFLLFAKYPIIIMKLAPPSYRTLAKGDESVKIRLCAIIAATSSSSPPSSSMISIVHEAADNLQDLEANCIQILARQFQSQELFPADVTNKPTTTVVLKKNNGDDAEEEDPPIQGLSSPSGNHDQDASRNISNLETKRPASSAVISPDRPIKAARRCFTTATSSSSSSSSWAAAPTCLLPTADDPMDEDFVMSLDSPRDIGRINPVHVIVRRHVFEVRRTTNRGRVFFQCACCKHRPRSQRAKLSTLAPQGVDSVYRAFVRFMMQHVSSCPDIPREIKSLDPKATKVPNYVGGSAAASAAAAAVNWTGGIKQYWASSARRMGLVDGSDGKSIVFRDPREEEEAELISDDETN